MAGPSTTTSAAEQEYNQLTCALTNTYRKVWAKLRALPRLSSLYEQIEHSEPRAVQQQQQRAYRDREAWLHEFGAFKMVVRVSMVSLDDGGAEEPGRAARVNYCRFTLEPMAMYHEVTTRACRELEEAFYGRGPRLTLGRRERIVRELEGAREAVWRAWRRDCEVGGGVW